MCMSGCGWVCVFTKKESLFERVRERERDYIIYRKGDNVCVRVCECVIVYIKMEGKKECV